MKEFRDLNKKIKAYNYAMNIVGWDSNTEAPRGSFPRRAEMMGVLSAELFRLQTGEKSVQLIYELFAKKDQLDPLTRREVEKAKKNIDKVIKIPENEYVEFEKLIQLSQSVWEEAKETENYDLFKPNLKAIIDYTKKFVSYYEIDDLPYNILLDEYEEGMSMKEYDQFFDVLRTELVPFVKTVIAAKKPENDAFMTAFFDKKRQEEFCDYLIDVFAFNRKFGLMKKSVHPFTWDTSPEDVRFTTRYLENYMFSSIFAAIHELGHATYEQQIDTVYDDTLLNGGTSMGIHESQSRFFENIIGRSYAFWEKHYPKLQSIFKEELKDVSLEDFFRAANKVEASFIRVEADELTYPMHIMLRYDLEKELIAGTLTVDELPTKWDDLMDSYLGIRPEKISDGVLQDVHWSGGMIGYFPTYVLGSAYSAQFYYTMKKELDIDQLIKEGRIKDINEWLKNKIHQFGSSKSPKELLLEVTNEPFNPMYYVKYLKEKYTDIFLK